MTPWGSWIDGERTATHYTNDGMKLILTVGASGGRFYARARVADSGGGDCLGDNFPSVAEAMAACERYALC